MKPVVNEPLNPQSVYREMYRLKRIADAAEVHGHLFFNVTRRALIEIQCHESFISPDDLKPDGMCKGYILSTPIMLASEQANGSDVWITWTYDENTA